jgi:hypothetical protein
MRISLSTVIISACAVTGISAQVNVLAQRYDNARTGANLNETILTPATVASNFGKLYARTVDGSVYGQPLYVSNVSIPGQGVHNVVYVATMNDIVYAFDADSNAGSNAAPLWSVTFVNPAAGITAVPATDVDSGGNIVGNIGIESTPVIDLPSNTIFLLARTKENGSYVQSLHALDITTGAERTNSRAVITGSVAGTGQGSVQNILSFIPKIQNQRASLAIANNNVLIAWASHEDSGAYHGWIMSYDKTSLQQTGVICSTPNGAQGGVWMSGWAPAVDSAGYAYYSVGNGNWDGKRDFSESVIKLGSGERLAVTDFFTPNDWINLNNSDDDLGSTGVLLIPGTTAAVATGKEGILYLANFSKLGWETATNSQIYQAFPLTGVSKGGPIFWNRANGTSMLYIQPSADYVRGFPLLPNGGGTGIPTLDTAPADVQVSTFSSPSGGGVLSLSGDPAGASAIVWSSASNSQDGSWGAVPGILRAFDASNGLAELWDCQIDAARDSVGNWAKFVPPMVANGRVYMATFSNQLVVYGTLN